jgi:uncharacterized protein
MNIQKWFDKSIIFECIAGSQAYGLNTPESDIDYRGVCIPPIDYFFGVFTFDQHEEKAPNDRTIFNIKKFILLSIENNPNIIELLFMPDDCIIKQTLWWDMLKDKRNLFLSKKCKHTYCGYAFAQIKRVRSHREWLLNPPKEKPTREGFGLPVHQKMSSEYMGALEAVLRVEESDREFIPSDIMQLYEKEKAFRNSKMRWEQYQNWVATRNPKRAELERKFGYDTKHIGHVFRLLIQGEEILSKGTLSVRLSPEDREFIFAIKNGAYPYDEIMSMTDSRVANMDTLYETSPLPHSVDVGAVNTWVVTILDNFFKTV